MAELDPLLQWRDRRVRETHKETLPPEVRMVIEQMKATLNDHEARVAQLERVNQALIAEASAKVRGAA